MTTIRSRSVALCVLAALLLALIPAVAPAVMSAVLPIAIGEVAPTTPARFAASVVTPAASNSLTALVDCLRSPRATLPLQLR